MCILCILVFLTDVTWAVFMPTTHIKNDLFSLVCSENIVSLSRKTMVASFILMPLWYSQKYKILFMYHDQSIRVIASKGQWALSCPGFL